MIIYERMFAVSDVRRDAILPTILGNLFLQEFQMFCYRLLSFLDYLVILLISHFRL